MQNAVSLVCEMYLVNQDGLGMEVGDSQQMDNGVDSISMDDCVEMDTNIGKGIKNKMMLLEEIQQSLCVTWMFCATFLCFMFFILWKRKCLYEKNSAVSFSKCLIMPLNCQIFKGTMCLMQWETLASTQVGGFDV